MFLAILKQQQSMGADRGLFWGSGYSAV